ncbi:MAG: phosphate ABC transporter substrate-binding protein [bacterium]|nr:phosphate ABC transporter substrate-binding protein [bacterium]MDD5353647.1 phosphate ABC transporter substrate-binding protein [bacterium]MDD5757256.1 phosphate ABC transporter substrate-binding protein [bacterium]
MSKIIKSISILSILILTAGNLLAAGQKLTMSGSTTVLPIAQKAAEEFMNEHPDVDISVRGGGSGVGVAAIMDGTVDIGNASRAAKAKEIATARGKGVSMVGTVVAKDGICIIVNKANSINSISLETAKKIYTGEISKWSEAGGSGGTIVIISRDTASGTFEVFNEKVLKGSKVREDAMMLASNQAILTSVSSTPGAIGYIGLGYVTDEVKPLVVNGVTASKETVISGKYPVSRPLYMYTNGAPKGLAKQFLDYLLSPTGQKLVEEVGFIAVK